MALQTYPFGIFSSIIIGALNSNDTVLQNPDYSAVINCFYLPGSLLGSFLMDQIGRKQKMTLGFVLGLFLVYYWWCNQSHSIRAPTLCGTVRYL